MPNEKSSNFAEKWHTQVAGIWHGCPSVFDSRGQYLGYIQADRKIFKDDNENYLIEVETETHIPGPMGIRLHHPCHRLEVSHKEQKRVYTGPDFYGAGYPYGDLILGNDYCVPWTSDNRVTVQLLPDGESQAYSTLLYQGGTLHAVVCGVYLQSLDFETNQETRQKISHHRLSEIGAGRNATKLLKERPRNLQGNCQIFDSKQNLTGSSMMQVTMSESKESVPTLRYTLEGDLNLSGTSSVQWHENNFSYHGPDFWGNGISYGRMVLNHLYQKGEILRRIYRK